MVTRVPPLLEDNYAHRHCSHLYALFDGLPEEIATNAPLRQAFKVAVDKRVEFRRQNANGEMAFGAVQIGLAAAMVIPPCASTVTFAVASVMPEALARMMAVPRPSALIGTLKLVLFIGIVTG